MDTNPPLNLIKKGSTVVQLSPTFHVNDTRLARPSARLSLIGADAECRSLVERLLHLAQQGLPRMFRAETRQFAFTRKRAGSGRVEALGESVRYGAITLLGARYLDRSTQRPVFGGQTAREYCGRMIEQVDGVENLGDAALLAWAAAELQHPDLPSAIARIRDLDGEGSHWPTVISAWVLSALVASREQADVEPLLATAYQRLMSAFNPQASVFPHSTRREALDGGRSHVACFADQVYPIQALARYHLAVGDERALAVADRCAARICDVQGHHGQWWWHYDSRDGSVLEGYPVYSVHQHAMAPMALLDLAQAGGARHSHAIVQSLKWLVSPPETSKPLIDENHMVVWRKVGRTDPRKLVRRVRAVASRMRPSMRVSLLNAVFRPTRIDYECRPYEFGWMLYAWLHNLRT
jgi:hypothetical protein